LVTEAELKEFLENCPKLYHMAEQGSWPSIRERGLLSSSAILDLYGVVGQEREKIEDQRRPAGVTVQKTGLPDAIIRDQIPMSDKALRKCLLNNLQPRDWYRLLNSKVFFWVSKKRLLRLLAAKAYRNKTHDILELDSGRLVQELARDIWLCPINSGSTIMNPRPRGMSTFARIQDYPYDEWRSRRGKTERVVELSVDYSVPNVREFVTRVVEMRGGKISKTLPI
jgi:hypothetical protein